MSNAFELARDAIYLERRVLTGALNLSGLGLSILPEDLCSLTHLQKLDISNNKLSALPSKFSNLTNLKALDISQNRFSRFPSSITSLSSLEELDIASNILKDLPGDLTDLTHLYYLRISRNPFQSFPDSISLLSTVKILLAQNIGLTEIPLAITKMQSLNTLNIRDNAITHVRPEFTSLTRLHTLHIDEHNLRSPPVEIVSRGPGAIINYLHAFESRGDFFELREAKLLVVGPGEVGKTCLMHRLINDKFIAQSPTTEGIEINDWIVTPSSNAQPITVHLWDFGGQEIYHSTHQFFLTKRSLYLLVWDSRRDDNIEAFDYWLNVISLLSNGSPVIIVQNKVDERIKRIDEESLTSKFPNIISFHAVSAKSGRNINDLRSDAADSIAKLEHIGDILPLAWQGIRDKLESLNRNYIKVEEYLTICSDYRLDEKDALYLSQYYHDLGVFLHFQDNHILSEIVFLKPDWATNAVYRLIDTKSVQNNFGRFDHRDLEQIWKEYPKGTRKYLLELMKKFELCFELKDRDTYVVPELLSHKRPDIDWDETADLNFQFSYNFMPAGIITRFIVRASDLIKGQGYWKGGVVLARDGTEAIVAAEPLDRRLRIQIKGAEKGALLAIIRRELTQIHKSLNNLHVREMIPCVCVKCSGSIEPYMHDYELLRRARERRKWMIECKASLEDVPIERIFEIFAPRTTGTTDPRSAIAPSVVMGAEAIDPYIAFANYRLRKEYAEDLRLRQGISSDQFTNLIISLADLDGDKKKELAQLLDEALKGDRNDGSARKIKDFAERQGIALLQGLSSNGVFEVIKLLFF